MATTNILVAGNEGHIADLARASVSDLDCQIIPAPAMSLALFLAQKNLPDLILCSFTMTDGDGWLFIKEVKSDEELSAIPFVFISAAATEDVQKRALSEGADSVLLYPLAADQLRREIVPYINIRLAEKSPRDPQTPE
jgi:CheY-like chemotaxis protein